MVYMCVCMYMSDGMYVCMHKCVYARMYVLVAHMNAFLCVHVCLNECSYVFVLHICGSPKVPVRVMCPCLCMVEVDVLC